MKRILMIALTLMICAACLASCARIEQEIGKTVSVSAVEAVAAELERQGVEYELADAQSLAEIQDALAKELAEEYDIVLQGELTAALEGGYVNSETHDWVKYWTFGFSATADVDAFETLACDEYADEIAQGKALVVNGGYIVNVTVSSVVIEQE